MHVHDSWFLLASIKNMGTHESEGSLVSHVGNAPISQHPFENIARLVLSSVVAREAFQGQEKEA